MTRDRYRLLAERRLEKIKKLTRELNAERCLTKALSKIVPSPKQEKHTLKIVRFAVTHRKMVRRSA